MSKSITTALAERLCRPQRIGLFGHRGVGKTTLLTMLYREAVGGRLPEIRLAAGDAVTADYLADKIHQLEAGDVPPATLAETPLRFQLYHRATRLELVVKDYQGEHVAVGREEPIRDFLRDCDAVWLCFDPGLLNADPARLRGEQEAEQIIEDYLAVDRADCPHRPMALVLTKADLLPPNLEVCDPARLELLVRDYFGMTMHALTHHAPSSAVFAVSSLGPRAEATTFRPQRLDQPLRWLVEALQAQDEARLDLLFQNAPRDVRLLERCVRHFALRHAGSPRLPEFEKRLRQCRSRQRRRRVLTGVAVAVAAFFGLWLHDRVDYNGARAFEETNDDLTAVRERWQGYLARPVVLRSKGPILEHLHELEGRIQAQNQEKAYNLLRRLVGDLRRTADNLARLERAARTTEVLTLFDRFSKDYPTASTLEELRTEIDVRIRPFRESDAAEALAELRKREALGGKLEGDAARKHLEELIAQADRARTEFSETTVAEKLAQQRTLYVQQLADFDRRAEEREFEAAQTYSQQESLNFFTRRERYQRYLSKYPNGAYVSPARAAIGEVEAAWDRHDYRELRDLFAKNPADFAQLSKLAVRYQEVHKNGKFLKPVSEVLAWVGRVSEPRDYTVKVLRGDFAMKIGRWFTKGPDLSVEIEVNGVKHGPTGIVKNNYDPVWDHEFARGIRWKPGDKVRVVVRDNDYKTVGLGRIVFDQESGNDDQLSMRLLSGKVEYDAHAVWFESDFNMPVLPKVD